MFRNHIDSVRSSQLGLQVLSQVGEVRLDEDREQT